MQESYFVYILRSYKFRTQRYKGFTEQNIIDRLSDHNAGKCRHTAKYRPWELIFYCAFNDKYRALAFEKYLKTASGIAFTRKRLTEK